MARALLTRRAMRADDATGHPTRRLRPATRLPADDLDDLLASSGTFLRELASQLTDDEHPIDRERAALLALAALTATSLSARAVKRASAPEPFPSTSLESALESAISLARPRAHGGPIVLASSDDARLAAHEVEAVRAIRSALLSARSGGGVLVVRAVCAGAIARIRIEPELGVAPRATPSAVAAEHARAIGARLTYEGAILTLEIPALDAWSPATR